MATITLPLVITPAILHAVELTMQRCFAEFDQAERDGASPAVFEHLTMAFYQATAAYKTAQARIAAAVAPAATLTQPSLFDTS